MTESATKKRTGSTIIAAAALGFVASMKTGSTVVVNALALLKFGWLLPSLGTLILSVVLYSFVYGWSFAWLIVALLFVHESGHWIWMRAYNLNPRAPIFVPMLGAFVAMQKMPADEATLAWVALAGPLVGGLCSLALFVAGQIAGQRELMAGGTVGFILNLFQLLPARPFDGGFIVGAISKWLLIPGTIALFAVAAWAHSPLLLIIGIFSVLNLFRKPQVATGKASTVLELEREFVSGAETGSRPTFELAKATKGQCIRIGIAYLTLAIGLGCMTCVGVTERANPDKSFAQAQVSVLTQLIARKEDARLLWMRSKSYATENRLPEAIADVNRAIALGKRDFDVYMDLARYKLINGDHDASVLETLDKAEQYSAKGSYDAWQPAYGMLICGDYDRVLRTCDRLGDNIDVKAEVLERTGHVKEAQALYDHVINTMPAFIWGTRWRRGMFNISLGNLDAAKVDLDTAMRLASGEPSVNLTMGWYLKRKGNINAAWQQTDIVYSELMNYTVIDKIGIASGCHKLRSELAEQLASTTRDPKIAKEWRRASAEELAAYLEVAKLGTIYIPRS